MLSPAEVYHELRERGFALQPGASPAQIAILEDAIGSAMDPYAREIYLRFNGFVENRPEDLSWMCVWSIEETIRFGGGAKTTSGAIIFGDRLICADFLQCRLSGPGDPMTLLESGETLANNYPEFWFKLLNSEYDSDQISKAR